MTAVSDTDNRPLSYTCKHSITRNWG